MSHLCLSGKTLTGKSVLSGVGVLTGTYGVPLEIILSYFKRKKLVVDWLDYIQCTLQEGHNPKTIKARIRSAAGDVYGPEYKDQVMQRVDTYI